MSANLVGGEAVLPHQLRSQMTVDDGGHGRAVVRQAQPPRAVFGGDLAPDLGPTFGQPQLAPPLDRGIARHGIGHLRMFRPGGACPLRSAVW